MANKGIQSETKEKKKYIYERLRKGKTPSQVIRLMLEYYDIKEDQARNLVYECNATLNKDVEEMSKDAANYVMNNLKAIVEDALEAGDRKSALAGLDHISKITKLTDDKPNITINNFGFDFDGGESDEE